MLLNHVHGFTSDDLNLQQIICSANVFSFTIRQPICHGRSGVTVDDCFFQLMWRSFIVDMLLFAVSDLTTCFSLEKNVHLCHIVGSFQPNNLY